MDWTALSVQGIIIIAATFVLRECFLATIKRNADLSLERFRHDCLREVEATRHAMNLTLERDKIAFGGVFAKRMESLGRLHELLAQAHGYSRQVVQMMSLGKPPASEELQAGLSSTLGELEELIKSNCVYWPAEIEAEARSLGNGCFWEVHKYFIARSRQEVALQIGMKNLDKYYESEDKARDAIEHDLTALMASIKGMIRSALEGQVQSR